MFDFFFNLFKVVFVVEYFIIDIECWNVESILFNGFFCIFYEFCFYCRVLGFFNQSLVVEVGFVECCDDDFGIIYFFGVVLYVIEDCFYIV